MITSQITPETVPMFLNELTQKLPLPLTSFKIVNQSLAVLSSYQDGDILRQYGDGKIFKDEHSVNLFRSKVSTEGLRAMLLTALVYQYSDKVIDHTLIDMKANMRAVMKKNRGLDRMIKDYSVSFWTRNQGIRLQEIRDEVKSYMRQYKALEEREVLTSEDEEKEGTPSTPPPTPESTYDYGSSPTIILTPELLHQQIKKMGMVSGEVADKNLRTARLIRRKSETHLDDLHASLIQEKKALEASVLGKPARVQRMVLTQDQLNEQIAKLSNKRRVEENDPEPVQTTQKTNVIQIDKAPLKQVKPSVQRKDFKNALLLSFAKFKPAIERANEGVFVMDREEKEWEELPPGQFEARPTINRTVSEFELGKTPEVRTPKPVKEEITMQVINELSNFLKQPMLLRRKFVKPPKEKKDSKNEKKSARVG